MPRNKIVFVLLTVWLFAIAAPSVISILGNNKKPLVSVNLNEEEQHDQGKKTLDEKKLIDKNTNQFFLLSELQGHTSYSYYLNGNSNPVFDVFLPPPEYLI